MCRTTEKCGDFSGSVSHEEKDDHPNVKITFYGTEECFKSAQDKDVESAKEFSTKMRRYQCVFTCFYRKHGPIIF